MHLLLCLLTTASAANLPYWSVDDFGNSGDIAGNNGWTNGYRDDPWYAYEGLAYSKTDVNTGDTGFSRYGQNTAADNWLVKGDAYTDGVVQVTYTNQDDDAFGLVSHLSGGDTFYLLFVTESNAPPPIGSVERSTVVLLRIEAGTAEVLDQVQASQSGRGDDRLSLRVNDGEIEARLNNTVVIELTDPSPLEAGQAGVYAYDTGGIGRNDTYAWASAIEVERTDDDNDQVADDEDNCEDVANADQADWDNNGIGDACDEQPPDDSDDTAPPTDDSAVQTDDSSIMGDDSGDGGANHSGTVTLHGACACASGKPAVGAFSFVFALLAALRRRR